MLTLLGCLVVFAAGFAGGVYTAPRVAPYVAKIKSVFTTPNVPPS